MRSNMFRIISLNKANLVSVLVNYKETINRLQQNHFFFIQVCKRNVLRMLYIGFNRLPRIRRFLYVSILINGITRRYIVSFSVITRDQILLKSPWLWFLKCYFLNSVQNVIYRSSGNLNTTRCSCLFLRKQTIFWSQSSSC